MAETHQDSGGTGSDFDLSQFYQIFFEEAGENLDQMEQMLLNLNLETADDEELNGIFRCAHSVKGGAATFGFADVAELTHQMESLLDRLRRHELQPNAAMVDVLLESADASRSLLARHQAGDEGDAMPTADLVRRISELAAGGAVVPQKVAAPAAHSVAAAPVKVVRPDGLRSLEIKIGPLERPEQADAISELFRDIPGLGEIKPLPVERADFRTFAVATSSTNEDLREIRWSSLKAMRLVPMRAMAFLLAQRGLRLWRFRRVTRPLPEMGLGSLMARRGRHKNMKILRMLSRPPLAMSLLLQRRLPKRRLARLLSPRQLRFE
jgi:two-component system chemotaxis sensor kinase CheA